MRNLKKVLSLTLAFVMLLGMMAVGAGAVETSFPDDSKIAEDNKEAVTVMNAVGVLVGDDKGNFNPGDTLTRAAAAKIVLAMVQGTSTVDALLKNTESSMFSDMTAPAHKWAAGIVDVCYNLGIANGPVAPTADAKGQFNPGGTLTCIEFAAMVARAVDPDGDYGNAATWETNVMLFAAKSGLAKSANITNWKAPMTRAQAAQVSFNGILHSPTSVTKYVVKNGAGEVVYEGTNETVAIVYGSRADHTIATETTNTGSLSDTVFKLTSGTSEDAFGRTTKTWSVDGKKAVELEGGDAVVTYTGKSTTVAQDLEGYTIASGLKATVNKAEGAAIANPAAIQNLTGNGKLVEVYASGKQINKVVVVEYKVGKLNVVTASNGNVTYTVNVPNGGVIDSGIDYASDKATDTVALHGDVQKDDYVTIAKTGTVLHIYPTTTVVGTMEAIASAANTITVNGTEYPVGNAVGNAANADKVATSGFVSLLGQADVTYYVDQNGFVVASSTSVTSSSNYAYILDVEGVPGEGATLENPNGGDFTLKVRAVLSDGTVGIYNIALNKVTEAGKVDGVTVAGAALGDFYVKGINEIKVFTASGSANSASNLTRHSEVYSYELSADGKTLTLSDVTAATSSAMTVNNTYVNALTADYTGGTSLTATKSALITGNTTFVVVSGTGTNTKASVFTGSLPLGTGKKMDYTDDANFVVMTAVSGSTATASVVFTKADIGVDDSNIAGYAYVDATSKTTTLDGTTKVDTYTGIAAGNETVKLTKSLAEQSITTGVWAFNEGNQIIGSVLAPAATEVVDGTMINDGRGWKTLTPETDYVSIDTALTTPDGNNCVVIGDTKDNATIVFIVSAPVVNSVSITGGNVSVNKGATHTFAATAEAANGAPSTVTWTVTGGKAGTTIDAEGVLTVAADETATKLTVTATSTFDASKKASVTVTVTTPAAHTHDNWSAWGVDPEDSTKHVRTCQEDGCDVTESHTIDFSGWAVDANDPSKHSRSCRGTGCNVTENHAIDFTDSYQQGTAGNAGKHIGVCECGIVNPSGSYTNCSQSAPVAGHDATNHWTGTCDDCGGTYGVATHTYSTHVQGTDTNANKHVAACSCGAVDPNGSYENCSQSAATPGKDANEHWTGTCDTCSERYGVAAHEFTWSSNGADCTGSCTCGQTKTHTTDGTDETDCAHADHGRS